jgi:hypothetical protein
MQVSIENLAIAVIGAIVIIVVLLIFGISIGYKENIERTNIGFYARVIITPILLIIVTYLYIQGQLNLDTLFFAIFWWLIPVIFCTDWSKIQRKQKPENEKE